MRPIATDGLSVCLPVTIVNPAKKAEPIEMPFGIWTRVCSRNHVLDEVHISACDGAILRAKRADSGHMQRSIYSKRLSRGQNRCGAGAERGVGYGDAHWRNLANTTEPSVCSSQTALCQITLTICLLKPTVKLRHLFFYSLYSPSFPIPLSAFLLAAQVRLLLTVVRDAFVNYILLTCLLVFIIANIFTIELH